MPVPSKMNEDKKKWGVQEDGAVAYWYFSALMDVSEAYRQMSDIKYQMEGNVEQNFLDPLAHLQQTDLREVNVCYWCWNFCWYLRRFFEFLDNLTRISWLLSHEIDEEH